MLLSRYVKHFPEPHDPNRILLYSTKRGASLLVPASLFSDIENGTLAPGDRDTLVRLGFLVPDRAAERREMSDAIAAANRMRRLFGAMVVMNLDCNLACSYCYEGGMKGKHRLSPETADLLCDLIERDQMAHGRRVELTFYGGEPLLSTEMIHSISRRLRAAAADHGVDYTFKLVTNGTLLTATVVNRLVPLGLTGAKVTLDGPQEVHDRYRPFVSGHGSYDTIVANLKEVCNLIKVQVGSNYTEGEYRAFPRLLDDLIAAGLTPDRLELVRFSPVTKSGGAHTLPEFNDGCSSLDEPWVAAADLFLRAEILRRGFHTPRLAPAPCMIESPFELVVQYDGTLFKCPAFLGWPAMAVGDLQTGINDYAASHNLDGWKNDACLDCAYLPLCFGGCRFLKLLRDGTMNGVDCRKRFLDATLETYVRQDLKRRARR